ncbi:hypothetical protein SAMN02745146_2335 [Hymenobacter daecheongensis DSM 21074]|uniref:Lipoprotein n=1 Tax=Hymenobacter daecheongensis DSM 21074 TaxID=1121955 RepID=A0A1M6GPE9_9BACT|nr:hypothetical protein [Hymenobacter daecheongensis]SHJ11833.1 hypothetical protein SAMN02745146_2335 [Hymenobacter daecheongensis DSM 21074]
MKNRLFAPVLGLLLTACTTSQETTAEVDRAPVPNTIRSDADRQAAYNSNAGAGGSVPDATPGRVRLGEQASGTNARKRVETLNTNDPNNTTPETRLRRLNNAPADTLRRP